MPEASPRSVTGSAAAPVRRQVSQSWGRTTRSTCSAWSGSHRASQRSLVTVKLATGTSPTASAQACAPPSSAMRSAASGAERTSFHSSAGRTTSPAASSATMPCCWALTASASTPSSRPPDDAACHASHQAAGGVSVPGGCGALPSRTVAPVSASTTTTLVDCVELSTPATSVIVSPVARVPRVAGDISARVKLIRNRIERHPPRSSGSLSSRRVPGEWAGWVAKGVGADDAGA